MSLMLGEVTNEKDLIHVAEALRQERLQTRAPFETQWWNNIALVAGEHYTFYEPTTREFVTLEKEPHEVRLVLNQARVVARTELAKITKSRPVMDIIARSSDEEDIAATRVGRFALDAAEWMFKLRRRRKSALWWTILTGVSGIYVGFDPQDDRPGFMNFYVDPSTGQPEFNPERIKVLEDEAKESGTEFKKYSYPLGDLEFKVYTPFQMLPNDTVMDWEDVSDIIVTDVVELSRARDQWDVNDLSPEDARPGNLGQRMLRRVGLGSSPTVNAIAQATVQVHTLWLKPGTYPGNKYLRDGVMLRWANGYKKLELARPYPFRDNRLPFAFFAHTPNAVSIWPDCTMTDIRPINLELDKTISQLIENRDYMLNPMWKIPKQAQVAPIKSQPGGTVEYVWSRDMPGPEQLPGIPMPTQIENLVVGLRDQILDISGQGEVSRGRVPSGVRAGNMLAFLQEEDETKIAPVVENLEDGIATMASLTLERFSQFYSTERLLRNYKAGGQADIRKFKGADLKNNTDVVVQAGSALPKLKSARQQYVMQLAEMGIETDPKRIRDMLELGEGEPDDIDLAFAQADRENEQMVGISKSGGGLPISLPQIISDPDVENPEAMGQGPGAAAIPVLSWHNHEAHLKRHIRFMTTAEFERLRTTAPDVVRLFDEHVTAHQQALQQLQMQQLQMMQAAQGGPEATTPPEGTMPMDAGATVASRNGA